MYGMVVVDDKEDIIKGIEKLGNWSNMDIEIAGTALNGEKALNIIKNTQAKILITDIRMPIMDGLVLTREVKKFDPSVKIILLSGYDDFSYAQQAVKLGAQEYLLKPAPIETIRKAVLRAKEQLLSEEKKFIEDVRLKQRVRESLPFLKNEYFTNLVTLPDNGIERMQEKLDYLEIELDTRDFKVMVVSLDDNENIAGCYSFKDYDLLMFSIINIVEETLSEFGKNVVFKSGKSEITIILNAAREDPEGKLFNTAELCSERIGKYLEVSISIGIGRYYREPKDISLSYQEAVTAVENRFVLGKNSIIDINDVDIGNNIKFKYPYLLSSELIQYVSIGAVQRADEIYDKFVREILSRNSSFPGLIKRYLTQLIFDIARVLDENGIDSSRITGNDLEYVNNLESYETLDEVSHELKKGILEITEYILNLKKINKKNTINVIDQYIKENYMKDLSLNDISRLVYMSPSYISSLIKEHFGESFVERITRMRIEQAKILLLSSEDKVYEVAEKVGYSDRRYFSDIFKKYTGLTPKEYTDKYKN